MTHRALVFSPGCSGTLLPISLNFIFRDEVFWLHPLLLLILLQFPQLLVHYGLEGLSVPLPMGRGHRHALPTTFPSEALADQPTPHSTLSHYSRHRIQWEATWYETPKLSSPQDCFGLGSPTFSILPLKRLHSFLHVSESPPSFASLIFRTKS